MCLLRVCSIRIVYHLIAIPNKIFHFKYDKGTLKTKVTATQLPIIANAQHDIVQQILSVTRTLGYKERVLNWTDSLLNDAANRPLYTRDL